METFHLVVLSVATVLLIVVLIFIGVLMNKGDRDLAYPPSYGTCPDYWTLSKDGTKCIIPSFKNDLNVGTMYDKHTEQLTQYVIDSPGFSHDVSNNMVTNYIDFNDDKWTGICSKKDWVNMLGVVWDGVSNYNECD